MTNLSDLTDGLSPWGDLFRALWRVAHNDDGTLKSIAPLAVAAQTPAQEPVRAQVNGNVGSLDVAARADHVHPASRLLTVQVDTYTLVLADGGTFVQLNKGTAFTVTIPTNAAVAFPVGSWVEAQQYGAGQITFAGAGGVTLRASGAKVKTAAQYAVVRLTKIGADEWVLSGDCST